jgi:hypothetical protein
MRYLCLLIVVLGFAGCGIPTVIEKSVTIEKDENGKVLKRIEKETVTQKINAELIKLETVKVEQATFPLE